MNTLQKLVEEPLGVVASRLRSALDPKTSTLGYHSRALATFLSRTPDKSIFSFAATVDLSTDMMLSSWAKLNCYELDFGLGLDTPEAVRRPQFDPFESLMYLMPKAPDGEIVAAICLRDEDMERLRVDEGFTKYARFIGWARSSQDQSKSSSHCGNLQKSFQVHLHMISLYFTLYRLLS